MTEYKKDLTAAEMLREARTSGRRKREISTISKLLCIREEYLAALENGDYKFIPEVVYILGFARNYAMELGLDPDEIVTKIKLEMGLITEDESHFADDEEEVDAVAAPVATTVKKDKEQGTFDNTLKFVSKNWKWFVAALAGIVIVVVAALVIVSADNSSVDAGDIEQPVVAIVKEPAYRQAVREKFGTENKDATIILQAAQDTWVKIEDARGNTVFSRVLVSGDIYYVPVGDKYKGTFGNAGGVDVWVDGTMAPKLGAMNVRRGGVLMTPEALMANTVPATAE